MFLREITPDLGQIPAAKMALLNLSVPLQRTCASVRVCACVCVWYPYEYIYLSMFGIGHFIWRSIIVRHSGYHHPNQQVSDFYGLATNIFGRICWVYNVYVYIYIYTYFNIITIIISSSSSIAVTTVIIIVTIVVIINIIINKSIIITYYW